MFKTIPIFTLFISSTAFSSPTLAPDPLGKLQDALKNTPSEQLKVNILGQIDEGMTSIHEGLEYLKMHNRTLTKNEFNELFDKVEIKNTLSKLRSAIEFNYGKNALNVLIGKYSSWCEHTATEYSTFADDSVTRYTIKCPSSVYGDNKLALTSTHFEDLYYVKERANSLVISNFELGILNEYSHGIRKKITDYKNKYNDE